MKKLLRISVFLNMALVAMTVWRHQAIKEARMTRQLRTGAFESTGRPIRRQPTPLEPVGTARTAWGSVESRSLPELVANLRAVGCPEQTIQDLVTMRVCREFRQRALELVGRDALATSYWQTSAREDGWHQQAQIQDLRDELKTQLEGLFGNNARNFWSRLLGWPDSMWSDNYLALEKTALVRDIAQRYRHLEQQERIEEIGLPFGFQDPELNTRKLEFERQKQEEIRGVLTPEEYEKYLLHESPAARYVRRHLPEAKSEDEYRTMVKVAAEFGMGVVPDLARLPRGLPVDEWDPEHTAANREQAFRQRLKEALGEDRVADQEKQEAAKAERADEERARQEFTGLAQSAGATVEEAQAFFNRIKELQPELKRRFDKQAKLAVTPEQTQAFKASLEAEFERIAATIMGEEKAKALVRKMVEKETKSQ